MSATAVAAPQSLDDVMLAMDIVDTLRHRDLVLAREYDSAERKVALVARLKEIYAAQGIDVAESILEDGVKALEEQRFVYDPPKDSLAVRLARVYISRDRWLKPLALVLGGAAFITAAYEYGFDRPSDVREQRAHQEISVEIPKELGAARTTALGLAVSGDARARVEAAYADGLADARAGKAMQARAAIGELEFLADVLALDLKVRIVSRPGEYSGVFRIPDDAPDARNYYLIVEAVDAAGRPHAIEITSEEDQKTARAEKWGVRVDEATFNSVAADKADDQIIENAIIGAKPRGEIAPAYTIATAGGAILEWPQ